MLKARYRVLFVWKDRGEAKSFITYTIIIKPSATEKDAL